MKTCENSIKITLDQGHYEIAYQAIAGKSPCVIFCGGFKSNMQGTKALALERYCQSKGQAFIRFDYFAHGDTQGDFALGSISTWLSDTLAVIDKVAKGNVVLVGSSLGGWLALLAALQRPKCVKALMLLACAVDMTKYYPKRLENLSQERDEQGRGFYSVPNEYGDQQPYQIYDHLLEDGKQHFLLDSVIELDMPVHLIHGKLDEVIPWQRSQQLHGLLSANNSGLHRLQLLENGDHRLSKSADLELIETTLGKLLV